MIEVAERYDDIVTSRQDAAATGLALVRAEGLEPEKAVTELLEAWGRGEVSDDDFDAARKELAQTGTLVPHPVAL